jgi:hypothetical protein
MSSDLPTDSAERAGRSRSRLAVIMVSGLLLATVAAFVETERLKLTPSPILDTLVSKNFAPDCRCSTGWASIAFRLRRRNLMTVEVITMNGQPVRRLVARPFGAGFVRLVWYGRSGGDQTTAPQAHYKVRVQLWTEHRTIVLPNLIWLDRTPPKVAFSVARRGLVPGQRLLIRYRLSEAAHPLLYVDGKLAIKGRWPYPSSSIDWFGKINGRSVRAGQHSLTMRARDLSGNLSQATAAIVVTVKQRHTHSRARNRH